jgi:coenzyme F420 hydrogenase subunit beta
VNAAQPDDPNAAQPDDPNVSELLRTVVSGGYCVGCGACAALRPARLAMERDLYGRLLPRLLSPAPAEATWLDPRTVCPFSDHSRNEDAISADAFPAAAHQDDRIGRWESLQAGYVTEGQFRENGTSGGMTSWVASELMRRDLVDAVLHVKPASQPAKGLIFEYAVSHTVEQVQEGAKARYYPCELSTVMRYVRDTPLRFALVSLPCFARAARLLRSQDPLIGERLRFQISLVCGHLKSTAYAEYYGWSAGIHPRDLRYLDFRFKAAQARTAKDYYIYAKGEGESAEGLLVNSKIFGTDWGLGFFKLKACDYCDDVLGETADVTLGDAWLPRYHRDPAGTNIIIVRHPELVRIIANAAAEGRIHVEDVSPQEIIQSQDAGFRHRRDGLAFRLLLQDKAGHWRPRKRVAAGSRHLTLRYRLIFRLREILRDRSHQAFADAVHAGSLQGFVKTMTPVAWLYWFVQREMNPDFWRRRLRGILRRVLGR